MNFYYDPILGLTYRFLSPNVFSLNIAAIPKDFNIHKALYYMKRQGVMMVNSNEYKTHNIISTQIITSHLIL